MAHAISDGIKWKHTELLAKMLLQQCTKWPIMDFFYSKQLKYYQQIYSITKNIFIFKRMKNYVDMSFWDVYEEKVQKWRLHTLILNVVNGNTNYRTIDIVLSIFSNLFFFYSLWLYRRIVRRKCKNSIEVNHDLNVWRFCIILHFEL